jgi:hypothetical protein
MKKLLYTFLGSPGLHLAIALILALIYCDLMNRY